MSLRMSNLAILFILIFKIVTCQEPSIVIVGAGASGIAAATKLLENGIENFKILEAESRIGGRINSIKTGESYIDSGAEFCRGEKENIVYETVKDMNLLAHSGQNKEFILYSEKPIDQEFGRDLFNLTDKIYDEAFKKGGRNQSLGDFCIKRYNQMIQYKYGNNKDKLEVAENSLDFFEHYVICNEGSPSWFDPICRADFKESIGDYSLNWKDKGYRLFLDILMKKYPDPNKQLSIDDKILLNKEVVNIYWDKEKTNNGVLIKCNDDSQYVADHIIFTPSLGVLKANADKLFVPNLPDIKKNAINKIAFGGIVKVIIFFPEKWWNHTDNILLWSDDDIKKASEQFSEGPMLEGRSWITHLFYITMNRHIPNALTAYFSGPLVAETETLPHELLKKGVYYVLTKFMGYTPSVGKIEEIIPSQFCNNPHFRGTFSYQSMNTTLKYSGKSSEEELAEPILNQDNIPLIQFAGEATNPIHYGTVHGAVEAGYREADRLITLYKEI